MILYGDRFLGPRTFALIVFVADAVVAAHVAAGIT
jgi:hypothetical protein